MIEVENVNEVYESRDGSFEGRVVANAGVGRSYRVETRVVGKPYGWQFVARYAYATTACDKLAEILNND